MIHEITTDLLPARIDQPMPHQRRAGARRQIDIFNINIFNQFTLIQITLAEPLRIVGM